MDELRIAQSKMTNEVLIAKARQWVSDLCESGGRKWSLRVPVDYENDPDMIFSEVIRRLEQRIEDEILNEYSEEYRDEPT